MVDPAVQPGQQRVVEVQVGARRTPDGDAATGWQRHVASGVWSADHDEVPADARLRRLRGERPARQRRAVRQPEGADRAGGADRHTMEPDGLGVEPQLFELALQRFGRRRDLAVDEHVVQPFLRVAELSPPDRHDTPVGTSSSAASSSALSSSAVVELGDADEFDVVERDEPVARPQHGHRGEWEAFAAAHQPGAVARLEVAGDQHAVDELNANVAARDLRMIDAEHRRRPSDEHRLRTELDPLPGDDHHDGAGRGPTGRRRAPRHGDQFVDDAYDGCSHVIVSIDRGVDGHRVAAASDDGSVWRGS